MSKIKIPSGRNRGMQLGTSITAKKEQAAREALVERKQRSIGAKALAGNEPDRGRSPNRKKYVPRLDPQFYAGRPKGQDGHFRDGYTGIQKNYWEQLKPSIACQRTGGFGTVQLTWLSCADCIVMVDWGLANGYLVTNEYNELYDPDPHNPERRKLRKEWNRMSRRVAEARNKKDAG